MMSGAQASSLANAATETVALQSRSTLMNRQVGVLVVVAGVLLIGLGLLIYTGAMRWFGKLPGDIRYESDHAQFYAPIVSMLIISLVLSLLFYLLRRFF